MEKDWYIREEKGILTETENKLGTPDGLWTQCKKCRVVHLSVDLQKQLMVCPKCDYHFRISSEEYFKLLFDKEKYVELFSDLKAEDRLKFNDLKPYKQRLEDAYNKTKLKDSIRTSVGKIEKKACLVCCMDFTFIGGSMGVVVGEKIALSIDYCIDKKIPLVIISKSGGARMMESAFSLFQMAKVAAKLNLLSKHKLPYVSVLTDPTTGGVTASYAMLGDINIAEPEALIGFAGPRVIEETIKKELPEGFQSSEYLMENGFLDFIVKRADLKSTIGVFLSYF